MNDLTDLLYWIIQEKSKKQKWLQSINHTKLDEFGKASYWKVYGKAQMLSVIETKIQKMIKIKEVGK